MAVLVVKATEEAVELNPGNVKVTVLPQIPLIAEVLLLLKLAIVELIRLMFLLFLLTATQDAIITNKK